MAKKLVRSVADLVRFGCELKMECGDCGAGRSLDGYQLAAMVGPGTLSCIQTRLRCSRCGAKAARLTILPPV